MNVGYTLRAAVTENLNLKVISVAFALLLYSLVHGSQEAQRSIRLNVVALLPQTPNRVLMTSLPEKINATVRGPKSTLDDLNADDIASVQIDLRAGTESRVTFEPSMIPLPPGLKVEQIDPPAIDMTWEDVIASDKPVQVGVVGTPAPGYVVKGAPLADPARVRMRGPNSRLAVIQFARADAFDVTGLTAGRYTRDLAIDPPPNRVELDVTSVSATVEVGREVAERPFTRVPVAVLGRSNAKVQPAEIDVRLSCPPEIVRALRPEQIVPRVQVSPAASSSPDHGSDVLPVQLVIDQCEVHLTPPSVIVRW
jgi:YbbR domain-containing protein